MSEPRFLAAAAATLLLLAGCGGSTGSVSDNADEPQSTASTGTSSSSGPFVSAHRGGAAYAPENTMMAFRNAVRLGVDDLEADAQLTGDGVVVLIHDDSMDRTTECSGDVIDMTLAQVQACDAAYWFSPGQPTTRVDDAAPHPLRGQGVVVPTADAFFAWAAAMGADAPQMSVEIKNVPGEANFDPTGRLVAEVLVPLIQAHALTDKVIVQSFFPTSLDVVKSLDPRIRTLFLSTSEVGITASNNLAECAANDYDISAPNHDAPDMDAAYVSAARAAGKLVVNWTADREADIQRLFDLGVDGVITNFPACHLALQGRPLPADVTAPELGGAYPVANCR